MKKQDLTGKTFGKLTVVSEAGKSSCNAIMWLCNCACGNTTKVAAGSLKSGNTKSCGCISKAWNKLFPGTAALNGLFASYKRNAKLRGYKFSLSIDQFQSLTSQNCHYCGVKPMQTKRTTSGNGEYVYNGIDRVNNNIGYESPNCVSCCHSCNSAKSNMGYSEFIVWIRTVYKNTKKYAV